MTTADRIIADIEFICYYDPEFRRDWEVADIGIDWILTQCDKLGDISAKEFLTQNVHNIIDNRLNKFWWWNSLPSKRLPALVSTDATFSALIVDMFQGFITSVGVQQVALGVLQW